VDFDLALTFIPALLLGVSFGVPACALSVLVPIAFFSYPAAAALHVRIQALKAVLNRQ
jgi:hypothetical protein